MVCRLLVGDCRATLATLPAASVSMCITSPPYFALRRYLDPSDPLAALEMGSEPMPEQFVANLVSVFREVKRVLHPTGVLVLNLGDSYAGSGKGPQGQSGVGAGRGAIAAGQMPTGAAAPAGYKAKDLMLMPFKVAEALRQDGWYLRSAMPWLKRCLSGGTWLYARTQKGDMPITVKDVARLDPSTVQLWNGHRWTQMVGMVETTGGGDRKENDRLRRAARKAGTAEPAPLYYEIVLRSGETIGCTPEHRWPTGRGVVRADELRVGDVLETARLPEPEHAKQPSGLDDQVVGWFVGLYIAEGYRGGEQRTITISGHQKEHERLARLEIAAAAFDGTCRYRARPGLGATIQLHGPILNGILDAYVEGEGAERKHLTTAAWQRSDVFLRAVLDGYLSGDGHWDARNNRWRLGFCNNDRLALDMRVLCARLGVGLRLKRARHKMDGRTFPGWRGQIRFDSLDRTTNPGGFRLKEDAEVVEVRFSRGRRFWDIEVADEPHLFALASGVLTHNSAMPESVTDRPSNALEWLFLFSKSRTYYFDSEAIRQRHADPAVVNGRYVRGGGVNTDAWAPEEKDGLARQTFRMKDREYNPAGRAFRNTDPFRISLDAAIADARADLARLEAMRATGGVLCDGDGLPLAVDVNPQGLALQHFASYPPNLVVPFVKAGTSERGCCARCLAPWARVVERKQYGSWHDHVADETVGNRQNGTYKGAGWKDYEPPRSTGWIPGCRCDAGEPIPCTVLDPFAGSGTTLLVADRLGRDAIGCELSEAYARLARERIEGDAALPGLAEVATAADATALPLFGEAV